MDTYEAMRTRRSTRAYRPDAVDKEKLCKIVEAGRYAPSGGNAQTNHIFVVTDPAVLDEIAERVQSAFAKMEYEESMYTSLKNSIRLSREGGYNFMYHAPALIIIANRKDYGNNMADAACAVENMLIEANELDLGSCYVNQLKWLNEEPILLEYLRGFGLKEDERVYAGVIVGTPATEDGLPVREPLERKGNEVVWI